MPIFRLFPAGKGIAIDCVGDCVDCITDFLSMFSLTRSIEELGINPA